MTEPSWKPPSGTPSSSSRVHKLFRFWQLILAKKVLFLFAFFAFTCIRRHGRCSGGLSQKWREERKSKNPKNYVWTCFVNLKIDSLHTCNTWFIICCHRAKDYVINNKKGQMQSGNTTWPTPANHPTTKPAMFFPIFSPCYRILWLDFKTKRVKTKRGGYHHIDL